jgi:PAS domain S-box-containing protein
MSPSKSNFLDKVLGRISRLDTRDLQTVVQRLARERNFLETLFNSIQDGVIVLDEQGRIVYLNQAVMQLLNWQSESVEGQPINRFLPDLDWKALCEPGGQERINYIEMELSYPRQLYLRLYATPLEGGGKGGAGAALILHDATEARQKTFEAIESERIASLTLLAASVAHEIGNPLNALHIHLQLMSREIAKLRNLPPPVLGRPSRRAQPPPIGIDVSETAQKLERYVNVAKGEITRLDYIITQFLQAIRPSPPQLKMASLNDAVQEALNLLRPELENRGLSVHEKLAARLPSSPLDSGQIQQVMVNLVKNAMQAMTKGGTLTLESGETPDAVWVSVSDTGGGIPQDQINRIFEPFYTTKKKGTGLGLMIVQRIVRQHGGRIELESRVGEGTMFRVWLPRHEPQPKLLEAHSPD